MYFFITNVRGPTLLLGLVLLGGPPRHLYLLLPPLLAGPTPKCGLITAFICVHICLLHSGYLLFYLVITCAVSAAAVAAAADLRPRQMAQQQPAAPVIS